MRNRPLPPRAKSNLRQAWNATQKRDGCIVVDYDSDFSWTGKEDCLYLDIYTTAFYKSMGNCAVMVWIHGGFFFEGDPTYTEYSLDHFIDRDTICVSINYRLGFLGFFHNYEDITGNMGLKDQLMALRFIQRNIRYFGGHPEKITLVGESSGAVFVSYLVQAPFASNLFQRAILQSGNTLAGWALARNWTVHTTLLFESHMMLVKLFDAILNGDNIDSIKFLPTLRLHLEKVFDPFEGLLFAPVLEIPSSMAVFTQQSFRALEKCEHESLVPILIGYNSDEGRCIVEHNIPINILGNMLNILYCLFSSSLSQRDYETLKNCSFLENTVRKYYEFKTLEQLSGFITDVFFVLPTIQYVKMFSKCNDVYFYRFSYKDATHGEDLFYLFSNFAEKLKNHEDSLVANRIVQIWSNFIKFGKPCVQFDDPSWPKSTVDNDYTYMDLDLNFTVQSLRSSPDANELKFWKALYLKCGIDKSSLPGT